MEEVINGILIREVETKNIMTGIGQLRPGRQRSTTSSVSVIVRPQSLASTQA